VGGEIVPIPKIRKFNVALPAAEANILSSSLKPTVKPSYFVIHITPAIAGVLRVARTKDGVTVIEDLNSGVPLTAGAVHAFTIAVDEGESINLRYSATGGAQTLTDVTGTATGSPITLAAGANTIVVTGAGTFDIALPAGVTGVATSGTATLVGSPVTLLAGATTTVDTGATTGEFTVTLTGTLKSLAIDEYGA